MTDPELEDRLRATRLRALQTVRRSIEMVTDVVHQNRRLAEHPDHRMSAEQRIDEGEAELDALRRQEAELTAAIESADQEQR